MRRWTTDASIAADTRYPGVVKSLAQRGWYRIATLLHRILKAVR